MNIESPAPPTSPPTVTTEPDDISEGGIAIIALASFNAFLLLLLFLGCFYAVFRRRLSLATGAEKTGTVVPDQKAFYADGAVQVRRYSVPI